MRSPCAERFTAPLPCLAAALASAIAASAAAAGAHGTSARNERPAQPTATRSAAAGRPSNADAAPPPRELTVAGCQMAVTTNVSANRDAIVRCVAKAGAAGASFMVTPEGSLSGYTAAIDQNATEMALADVVATAAKARVGLFLGTIYTEQTPSGPLLYDEQRVYARDGTYLGFNAKQLTTTSVRYPGLGEERYYVRGKPTTFAIEDDSGSAGAITAGALICNDMWADPTCSTHDPFLSHVLATEHGAEVIFHSVNGGAGNVDVALPFHHSNLQYRAQVDALWIVVAQAAQPEGQNCATGVVAPNGSWVAKAKFGSEQMVVHRIDIGGEHRFGL